MEIKRGNIILVDVFLRQSSYTLEEINGSRVAYLEFDILNPVEFTINDYIEYLNNKYYIRYKENVSKEETSLGYSYKITLYHELYRMHDITFFLYSTPDFRKNMSYYNANAQQVLQLIVNSLNRVDSGWSVGSVMTTKTLTFNFKDKSCADVLQEIINTYDTEFWVDAKTIHIGKRELSSNNVVLSQGEGFRSLTLSAVDETPPITRLYAYGSDKNMTAADGDYLGLPGGTTFIEKNVSKYGVIEHVRQFDDVFPHGTFTVSQKIDDFTLCASDVDFDLTNQLIDGVEVIVTFQDGELAGYDLAIVDGSWDNGLKKFKLKKNEEENALSVPGDINFTVGDTFILTGLRMPQSYIDAAEQELLSAAQAWLDEKCENRVQLQAVCDEIYFAEHDLFISCGQMIGVYNAKLGIDREIRTTSVKRYIENNGEKPYRYEITISDFLQNSGLSQVINDIKNIPDEINRGNERNKQYTKRQFRDAIELLNALFDAFKDEFDPGITPVFVHTMQLLVGSERLQYRFVDNKTNPVELDHAFNFDTNTKTFYTSAGIIQHMTHGIDALKPSHTVNEYTFWDVAAYSWIVPDMEAYWLYIRCSKTDSSATFRLSKTTIGIDDEIGYHHFICGYLNSEFEGDRSFVTLYGFTEILPGQIRVNKIMNPDGTQFWDMLSKMFKIGDANSFVSWNVEAPNQLVIKGTIVQSPSGDTDYLGVDRGFWVTGVTYYPGDIVKLALDGNVYKCLLQNISQRPDLYPAMWRLVVSKGDDGTNGTNGTNGSNGQNGQDGAEGRGYLHAYFPSNLVTTPTQPPTPGVIPSGWFAQPDFNGMKYIYFSQSIKTLGVWGAWSLPTLYAVYPEKGHPGPAIVFRGEWTDITKPATFYNNAARRDVVRYNGTYYIYSGTDAASVSAFNSANWDTFGAQFSSVATDLLLAINANVGGWIFQNGRLQSQAGGAYMDGRDGSFNLGNGNFTVDASGNVATRGRVESNASGNRIIIDPAGRTLTMFNSNGTSAAQLFFYGDGSFNTARMRLMSSDMSSMGSQAIMEISPTSINFMDGSGLNSSQFSRTGIRFDIGSFPTASNQVGVGGVYRNGNTLMIRTS